VTSGYVLGDEFGELAKLEERRRSVIEKVSFCQRAEARQALVLLSKKLKIARCPHSAKIS
jgi:N-acetylmuramic acid 6-phosphate (MurNAc-6-P) etherase